METSAEVRKRQQDLFAQLERSTTARRTALATELAVMLRDLAGGTAPPEMEGRFVMQVANRLLVMAKESSMMMKAPTRIESRWAERGVRLKCVEEMVVIGLISVFVGLASFVSKLFLLFTR